MARMTISDWASPAFLADPYPFYRDLRENDPVHFDESREVWMLMRYTDISEVLHDDVRFSAELGPSNSMLVTDPPEHTRLRGLVNKAFTAKTVQGLRPRIEEIVGGLLDAVEGRSGMDVIAEFAYPLPITVIAEMLGVEPAQRDFFRRVSEQVAFSLGPAADPHAGDRANEGRTELVHYFEELIAKRRAEPRDDLVSALIRAEEEGDLLSHSELLAMLVLLLIGGHETTVNLIANGLLALLRNPDQLDLFSRQEGSERQAVEELLRYDSPVQYTGRVVTRDVEMRGKRIRAGDRVRLILASANRDEEIFEGGERLDITRDPCLHLSFGIGTHFCLGAQLARLEGAIALAALVRRFPNLRLTGQELAWRPAPVLRGLEALPVALDGGGSG